MKTIIQKMKTIIQKIWMLIAMLCACISSYAYDIEVDGIYYNITSLTDLTCEVTSGDNHYEGDIAIPSEITYNSRNLTVTSIGREAFYRCLSLTSVTIPNSVTSIGYSAFKYCRSLTSVTIPNSVTSIGYSAFCNCLSLTSVIIPNSVTSIESSVFKDCTSLTSVIIPNSVTSIGGYAFEGCSSLTSLTIPDSVTSIESSAFKYCSSLTSLTIPDSVTSIGSSAFSGCSSLVSIILSNSLEYISCGLFNDCKSLEALEVPGSVEIISQCYERSERSEITFDGCSNLNKLFLCYSSITLEVGYTLPSGLHSGSWEDWTQTITDLYIDRALEKDIPVPNLEKLEIGENVTKVQIEKIYNLEKLTTIYSYALTPPKLPTMSNKQYMDMMVYVPEEAIEAYRNAYSWKNFWNLAPINGINDIENDIDSDAPVHIYSINGMEMRDKDSLPAGIYIMRQGSKTKKIVVGR